MKIDKHAILWVSGDLEPAKKHGINVQLKVQLKQVVEGMQAYYLGPI